MWHCTFVFIAALLLLPLRGSAGEDAEKIVRESDRRQRVQSQTYDGQLEVADSSGKVFQKGWQLWRENHGAQSKVLVRFHSPPEVDGVGLLVLARPGAPDDQWMYTPAIRRDRRIAAQDRSARFMGTDFSHEDMELRDIDEYRYDLLGLEIRDGHSCWKIRAKPKENTQSQYSWSDLWIRQDNYLVIFVEMYVKEKKRKTLELSEIAQIQGIWTAQLLRIKDLERGSTTTLRLRNIRYNASLAPDFFTLRTLRGN